MSEEKNKPEFEDNWPLFEKFLGYLRYLKIRKYIKKEPKPVCVDIGCGFNGRFLVSISKHIKKGYGFDLQANEQIIRNVKIVNNTKFNGKIPLKNATVDRVFMLAVIEHLDMKTAQDMVNESARVLNKDGLLVLTTPTPMGKPVLEFLSFKLGLISKESILEHQHYYTESELKSVLENAGLECLVYKKFQFGFNEMIVGIKKENE